MRSAVSLADLLRVTEGVSDARADARASALGYEAPSREVVVPGLALPEARPPSAWNRSLVTLLALLGALRAWWQRRVGKPQPAELRPAPVEAPPSLLTWWRVEQMTTFPEQQARGDVVALTREDIAWEPRPQPLTAPLKPWRKLWPTLRAMLRSEALADRPDVPELVRRVADGEIPSRIPRARRDAWSDRVTLVLDRSRRLIPFWSDQDEVSRRLRKALRGAIAREVVLDDGVQVTLASRHGDFADACRGEAVLVLGDLGSESEASTQRRWRRTAEKLSERGARVRALVPTSVSSNPASETWVHTSWEGAVTERRDALEMLLAMVSMTCFCEPGLLRALRKLVPGASAATEVALWRHDDVYAPDSNGLVVRAERVAHWRRRFVELVSRERANDVSACIERWHAEAPPEMLNAETLAWVGERLDGVRPPGSVEAASRFVEGTLQALSAKRADPVWRAELRAWAGSALPVSVGEAVYARVPATAELKARVMRDGERVPREVVLAAVRLGSAKQAESPFWAVRQVGGAVVLRAVSSERWPSEARGEGSPLATLKAQSAGLLIERDGITERTELRDGLKIPLRGREVVFTTDRGRVALGVMDEARWMRAVGRDVFGLWAEWELGGVAQRMRWIPGGVFQMGSLDDEERWESEVPRHEVELTRGYWLSDTPVTQSLWSAVMGRNPSHFNGAEMGEHPVEQVSWDDCQVFVRQVNERVPGLSLRLPTEAEWERACRGGTDGPTWLGKNDAATLDQIAWYSANSGVLTHAVREKAANPFGLYDVLGNVAEWCDDFMRTYEAVRAVDPYGVRGTGRVSRGGSWDWVARDPRAAFRLAYSPSYRIGALGFRVAGGQGLRSSQVEEPEPRSGVGASRGAGGAPESASSTRDAVTTPATKGGTR